MREEIIIVQGDFAGEIDGPISELYLREIIPEDYNAVHIIASNPICCRYTIWGPNTEKDTQNFIEQSIVEQHVNPRTHWTYALCRGSTLVGTAAIWMNEQNHVELGYLVHPAEWGKGYASQAARLLLDFAQKQWPDVLVQASTDPENLASRRVLEKSGFRLSEYIPEHKQTSIGSRDSVIYRYETRISSF